MLSRFLSTTCFLLGTWKHVIGGTADNMFSWERRKFHALHVDDSTIQSSCAVLCRDHCVSIPAPVHDPGHPSTAVQGYPRASWPSKAVHACPRPWASVHSRHCRPRPSAAVHFRPRPPRLSVAVHSRHGRPRPSLPSMAAHGCYGRPRLSAGRLIV